MKLIIRDDDLSYFADHNFLEKTYGEIWDKCPISFATIPFVKTGGFETPLKEKQSHKLYGIGDNKELVEFLKTKINQGKVTIVQHGYSHRNYGKNFELERTNEKQIYSELKKGKEYLEELFGIEIKTLVPPHDRMSKQAMGAAEKIGFKYVCRGFSPLPRELKFNFTSIKSFFKLLKLWLKHKTKYRYPTILNWDGHKEIYSYRPDEILRNFDDIINFHKENGDLISVTTHYRSMNLHTKELLQELIKRSDRFTHLNGV